MVAIQTHQEVCVVVAPFTLQRVCELRALDLWQRVAVDGLRNDYNRSAPD